MITQALLARKNVSLVHTTDADGIRRCCPTCSSGGCYVEGSARIFCQMRLPDLVAGDHECKVQKLEMKNRILRQHCDESEMVT
jgi:hypothetical protein